MIGPSVATASAREPSGSFVKAAQRCSDASWGRYKIALNTMPSTIPISVVVLLFQRRIVSGLTAGAVKG